MKFKEYIDGFNKARDKEEFVNKNLKTKYISYEQKCNEAKKIVNYSMYYNNGDMKLFKFDTPSQYMLFIYSIFTMYCDVTDDGYTILDIINELFKNNIVVYLFKISDVTNYKMILDMMINDEIEFNTNLTLWLDNKFQSYSVSINNVFNDLMEKLNEDKVG